MDLSTLVYTCTKSNPSNRFKYSKAPFPIKLHVKKHMKNTGVFTCYFIIADFYSLILPQFDLVKGYILRRGARMTTVRQSDSRFPFPSTDCYYGDINRPTLLTLH